MKQSDLYKHLLEKFKGHASPDLTLKCLAIGKDTHLKWHPGHRILLWTEDSRWPLAPAVHVGLLCRYSSVISQAVGGIPVEFWDLDF